MTAVDVTQAYRIASPPAGWGFLVPGLVLVCLGAFTCFAAYDGAPYFLWGFGGCLLIFGICCTAVPIVSRRQEQQRIVTLAPSGLTFHDGREIEVPWSEVIGQERALFRGQNAIIVKLTGSAIERVGDAMRDFLDPADHERVLSTCGIPLAQGSVDWALPDLEAAFEAFLSAHGRPGAVPE